MNRKRGVGLIEGVLFIVIAVSLVVGGVVYFQQSSEAARVNDAVRSIVSIQSGVRSLYQAGGSFGATAGSDLAPAAIAAGIVSPRLVDADGQLSNEWAGQVQILGYPAAFTVDYRGVPKEACIRLAPHSVLGNGAAGNGIAAVAVNGAFVDENGDGAVSPSEAAAACGVISPDQAMRWAFMPDANMRIEAAQLEQMLGIAPVSEPTETGRTTQAETAACPEGYSGDQTRSREVVSYSDGTSVTADWSDWSQAACVALVAETSRTTEVETAACATGYTGQQSRSREVIGFSDGTTRALEWTEWDAQACLAITVVGTATETENGSCPSGQYGNSTRTRSRTDYSDGTATFTEWSGFSNSNCHAATEVRTTYTAYRTVPVSCGSYGKMRINVHSQTVQVRYDGQKATGPETVTTGPICSAVGAILYGYVYQDCPTGIGQQRRQAQFVWNEFYMWVEGSAFQNYTCAP